MTTTYLCTNCGNNKTAEEFNKCKSRETGLQAKCKICDRKYKQGRKEIVNQQRRLSYLKNKEKIAKQRKAIYDKNPEKMREQAKIREQKPSYKEKRKLRQIKNKEKLKENNRRWRQNNPERHRKYQREYAKNKRATNMHFKLEHRLRNRLLIALKIGRGSKTLSFRELIGCTIEELKIYIEKLFTEGMTWEKVNNAEIEIDHIKPCCSFDLTSNEEQKKCFHYTNLQPLWWEDNRDKLQEDLKLKIERVVVVPKDVSI